MSTFNSLPLELKLSIFSNFSLKENFQLRAVCKEWKLLLFDKSLLRHLDCSNTTGKGITDNALAMVLSHAQRVDTLNVFNCFELTGASIIQAARDGKLKTLKSLCVSWSKLGDEVIVEILKATKSMSALYLMECEISDQIARHICMEASDTLWRLTLPGIRKWSNESISAVIENCPFLNSLDVTGNTLSQPLLFAIFGGRKGSRLERLILRCTSVDDEDVIQAMRILDLSEKHSLAFLCVCQTSISEMVKRELQRRAIRICESTEEKHGITKAQKELLSISASL